MGQVPIDDIHIGDWVYARDADGQIVLRMVTDEIVTEDAAQLFLTIEHEDGRVEMLATTDEHPFWVEDGRGFVRADELSPGDVLKAATGESIVRGLSISGDRTTVYNLTVEGVHTYLVGPDGVWVHNCSNYRKIFIKYFEQSGRKFPTGHQVHHRIPQEHRALFPSGEVDQLTNWVGVPRQVHGRINGRWNTFRSNHPRPTAAEVRQFASEVDAEFARHYLYP